MRLAMYSPERSSLYEDLGDLVAAESVDAGHASERPTCPVERDSMSLW